MGNGRHRQAYRLRSQLLGLVQLEEDAVGIYDEALVHLTDTMVREALERFRDDHRGHLSELPYAIQTLGWATRAPRVDLTGHIEEFAVRVRSMTGVAGVLNAMAAVERVHNRRYAEAMGWEIEDSDLAALLRMYHDDERRHLAFIEESLAEAIVKANV